MSDDLKNQIRELQKSNDKLSKRLNSIWRFFYMGIFQGIGAVIGATAFVLLVGFILNFLGVFEPIHDQVETVRQILREAVNRTPSI